MPPRIYPERVLTHAETSRRYYEKNRDRRVREAHEYRLAHPDVVKDTKRKCYEAHAEERREYRRQYHRDHPKHSGEYNRKWRAANPDKARWFDALKVMRRRGAPGRMTLAEWRAIIAKQHGRCATCKSKCNLTKDHIIPVTKGGTNYAFNIQGLCRSCNSKKRNRLDVGAQHSLFDRMVA